MLNPLVVLPLRCEQPESLAAAHVVALAASQRAEPLGAFELVRAVYFATELAAERHAIGHLLVIRRYDDKNHYRGKIISM